MAILSDADRQRLANGLMRYFSNTKEQTPGILKADIRAGINATDSWIETNQANWNAQLPAAIKNNFTPSQKAVLFCLVALMRANPGMVRQVFGELD